MAYDAVMCRSIRSLHNYDPPTSDEEIAAAALQYVRKVSGMPRPSAANTEAFERAVAAVTAATHELLDSLVTSAAAARSRRRDREGPRALARPVRSAHGLRAHLDALEGHAQPPRLCSERVARTVGARAWEGEREMRERDCPTGGRET